MRSLRIGVSVGSLMLAGSALAPATAAVLDLNGAPLDFPVFRANLDETPGVQYTGVTNGALNLTPVPALVFGGDLFDGATPFSLTKLGENSLTLTGTANTYSGLTRVFNGTLISGATNTLSANSQLILGVPGRLDFAGFSQVINGITGQGAVVNSGAQATLTIDTDNSLTFIGDIEGDIRVRKAGLGAQTFLGSNSYTGGTDLAGGALNFGNNQSFGTGAILVSGSATLAAKSNGLTLGNAISIDPGVSLTVGGRETGYSGVISGAGQLIKVATSRVRLENVANTFSGGIQLNGGGIIIAGDGSLGTGTLTTGATDVILGLITDTSVTLQNDIVTGGQLNLELPSAGNTLTLNGIVSGPGRLFLKSGGGTLLLNGANTYQGSTLVASGVLGLGSNAALGAASQIAISGPAGIAAYADNLSFASVINSRALVTVDTNPLGLADGFDLALTGRISNQSSANPASLIKIGTGTLTLASTTNSYTGPTTVAGGTLNLTGRLTSNVDVQSGATFGGTGNVAAANTVTVQSGGAIAPGVGGAAGALTVGNLALNDGAILNFGLGAPGVAGASDRIDVTGNFGLTGTTTVNIDNLLGFAEGSFRLVNYGTRSGAGLFAFGTTPVDFSLTIDESTANQINLIATFTGVARFWDGNGPAGDGVIDGGNGTWATGATNWTNSNGTAVLAWANTVGVFQTVGGTVDVVGTQGFSNLSFTVDGYVLNGGELAMVSGTLETTTGTTTINSVISGINGLTKTGAGTLALGGVNTYSGGTALTAGELQALSDTAFGAGDLAVADGTVLSTTTAANATLANNVAITGTGEIRDAGAIFTLAGVVSGDTLAKSGAGTLVLNGINTYTGGTILNSGTIRVGTNAALGTAALTMASATPSTTLQSGAADLDIANAITIAGAGIVDTQANILTLSGVIDGGELTKIGAGTLILTAANTHTGGTNLDLGTLTIANNAALGTGALAIADATTLRAGLDGIVVNNAINITGTGTIDTGNNAMFLNGVISDGASAGTLNKTGSAQLFLSNTNSYSGGTTLTEGGIDLGNNAALGTGSLAMANATTLRAGVVGLTIGNIIQLNGTNTIDTQAFDLTLSGTLADGEGSSGFSKVGSGTLTLAGASSYTGATTVDAGTLSVTGSLGTTAVGVAAGATLAGTGSIAGTVTIADNATLAPGVGAPGALTLGGLNLSAGSLVAFDLGAANVIGGPLNDRIIVTGNLVIDGGLTVNQSAGGFFGPGLYNLFSYGTLTDNGLDITSLPNGFSGVIQNNAGANQINLVVASPGTNFLYWDGADAIGNGVIDGGTGSWTPTTTNWTGAAPSAINTNWVDNSVAIFAGVPGAVTLASTYVAQGLQFQTDGYLLTGGTLLTPVSTFIITDPGVTATIDSAVDGAGEIVKQGTGTLVLGGTNSYAGGTNIQAGTLAIGNANAVGTGTVTLQSNSTLAAAADGIVLANAITTVGSGNIDSGPGIFTLAGVIGGPGSISQIGTGNLVLNGDNGFTNLGINQGTVTVGTNTAAGIGGIAINDNATLAAGVDGLVLANGIVTTGNGIVNGGPGVFTLNGVIGGTGSISSVGTGNLVLNGANGFTNLGINQGTVTVGSNGAAGIGNIAINSNATLAAGVSGLVLANDIQTTANGLVDSGAGVFTLNGDISGPGSISQVGTGNLVLNGNNSFTNLGIDQGTVTVGSDTAAGIGDIAINDNTTLAAGVSGLVLANDIRTTGNGIVDAGAGIFTLSNNISGAGSISQVGTGNLVLNGDNSFGNLGIDLGTVTVGSNTAAGIGSITINNNATLAAGASGLVLANNIQTTANGLVDSGAGVFTLGGNITGPGSISQVGTGNLVLNGDNSFTNLGINQGTVTVGSNTAAGNGNIAINNNATLAAGAAAVTLANAIQTTGSGVIDSGSGVFTLSGVISDAGSITKIGSGTLVLAGANLYTGATVVTTGNLNVTGSIGASATNVLTGATLSGTGTVGALTAQGGSQIAPGNGAGAVGTLTVNGGINLLAGSTFVVDASSAGADRITASGPATIAGNITVVPGASPYRFGATTILSSSARTGIFANDATVVGAFGSGITSSLSYDATSVFLNLRPNSLIAIGGSSLTGNAFQVAAAFDRAVAGGYDPTPFFAIYTQGANLPTALNQLSGEIHSAERRVLLEDTRVVREAAFDRLNAGLSAIAGNAAASSDVDGNTTTFWLRGAGSWGTAKADDFGSRFETEQKGVLAGVDYATGGFKIGALFHYITTDIDFATLGSSKVESTGGAVYAGYRQPARGFAVGIGGSLAKIQADASRAITAPGLAQSLNSNYDGKIYHIFGEVAYDLIGSETTRVEPFARLAHAQVDTDGFTETGGIAALRSNQQRHDLTILDVGLRGGVNVAGFDISGSAAWHRVTGDRSAYSFSSINGLNSQAGIRAAALDRHAVAVEAQAKFAVTQTISIGAGYSGVIGDRNQDHGARATLTVGF